MSTTFRPHPNNVTSTLATFYNSGTGVLSLASGTGALFGSTFPITVTVATAATAGTPGEINTIFTVTGRSVDNLTGVSAIEGTTDRGYLAGDRVDIRWTSGLASAIETAVNGVENSTGITAGTIAAARLGSGLAQSNRYLRGDSAWAPIYLPVSKTGIGTLAVTDTFCVCDASSGAFTLTLPPSSVATQGNEYIFYKSDATANAITISRSGTDVIIPGGLASISLATNGKYARMISNGGGVFLIVGSN